jgi:hypothetical protein
MTEKSSQEDGISRRELVVATGAAAVVGSALAATGTPASAAAPPNEEGQWSRRGRGMCEGWSLEIGFSRSRCSAGQG